MLKEKAGVLAGQIWVALNETEGLTQKQIKIEPRARASTLRTCGGYRTLRLLRVGGEIAKS